MFGVFRSLRFCLLLIILRVFFYYFIFQLRVFSSVSNVFHGVPQVRLSSLRLCLVSCYVTSYFILVVPCLVCLVLGVTSLCLIYFSFLSQVSSPFYTHIISGSPCPLSSCSSWLCVTLFCGSEVILVISCNLFLGST